MPALAAIALFGLGCSAAPEARRVEIGSPQELLEFFESLDYTAEAWEAGIRAIPRAYVMEIGDAWRIRSQDVEVVTKKRLFFRALGPLVLRANELILADRERLATLVGKDAISQADTAWLRDLSVRYAVEPSDQVLADAETRKQLVDKLMKRVDIVPVSLVLAQGAEESGWGTSRFAAEGNALFGQWTWGGSGIQPRRQRKGMGDYRIAAFDTPLESVQAYLRNINTNLPYRQLRLKRADLRAAGREPTGPALVDTLVRYSERGPAYVKALREIMDVNRLPAADEAHFSGPQVWHLHPKDSG